MAYALYDQDIITLYQRYPANNYKNITDRIADYSKYFLGQQYKLYPIGEGVYGKFDRKPLYRTDMFDCFSYVTFVLSLAESKNLAEFKTNYIKINYINGKVAFTNRYHFTNDWNKANAENGYLVDITDKILDQKGKPIYKIGATKIDKPNWYKNLTLGRVQSTSLLKQLQKIGAHSKSEISVINYLPLAKLFNDNEQPNMYLFKQIPSGSIIEIVRVNWDLTKTVGTDLDVSHVGFAIRTEKGLMFRAASSSEDWGSGVIDIPLAEYLKNCLNTPSIGGINVQLPK